MRFIPMVTALVLIASCAKGTATNPILPPGVSPTPLPQPPYVGIGRYQQLSEFTQQPFASGVPFASFVEVDQSIGTFLDHRDVGGFVFVVRGPHVLSRPDRDTARVVA